MRKLRPLHLAASVSLLGLLPLAPAFAGPLVDPVGDTFGSGPFQPDITGVSAHTNLALGVTTFTVRFDQAVSPPSASRPNTGSVPSVVGFIDLDIDKKAATGGSAPWPGPLAGGNNWINSFIPPNTGTPSIPSPYDTLISLGDEYFVDLFSEQFNPGFVDIVDTSTNAVFATVPVTFGTFGFTLDVPLVGTGDGTLNYGLLMGSFAEQTDRAPNGAEPAQSELTPEPASLALLATGLVAGLAWELRRRRSRQPAAR